MIVVLLTRAVTQILFPAIFHILFSILAYAMYPLNRMSFEEPGIFPNFFLPIPPPRPHPRLWASSRWLGLNGPLSPPLLVLLIGIEPWSKFVDLNCVRDYHASEPTPGILVTKSDVTTHQYQRLAYRYSSLSSYFLPYSLSVVSCNCPPCPIDPANEHHNARGRSL